MLFNARHKQKNGVSTEFVQMSKIHTQKAKKKHFGLMENFRRKIAIYIQNHNF